MKNLLVAGKLLLLDLASTFFFLIVYSVTKNIVLSVVLGMALGVAQIGWELARKKPIDTMQWLSLFLVMGFGTATLISNNPRFVMVKPSRTHLVVGVVMLEPGWMNRYLPPLSWKWGDRKNSSADANLWMAGSDDGADACEAAQRPHAGSSSNAFASFRSRVSNPSVNQP